MHTRLVIEWTGTCKYEHNKRDRSMTAKGENPVACSDSFPFYHTQNKDLE